MPNGDRPPLDEWLSLFRAVIAKEGTTTGAGAATGDSIIDSGLIGAGDNSFKSMLMVLYPGQPNNVDSMDITAFNNVTGEVTLAKAYKDVAAAIPAGVPYKIVTFRFVPAEVAALAADVGDASTSTLGSLYGILGDPAQDFLTMIGYEGATSLADKLTAARALLLDRLALLAAGGAGELTATRAAALQRLIDDLTAVRASYLDNINNAQLLNVPDLSTLSAARIGYLDNINQAGLLQLTTARAGYLDNINNADLANIIRDIAETTGTFNFDETSALEQTVFTLTITARSKIGGIWLDFTTVTQDLTIRVKHQIDGANYRTFQTSSWATTDDDGVLIEGFTAYRNVQLTLQCGGGGAGAVNIPYAVV